MRSSTRCDSGRRWRSAVATDPGELERARRRPGARSGGRFAALGWRTVDAETLAGLVPQAPRTGVVAIARRKAADLDAALADPREAPVVLLEQPRNMGNLGACVRVAAAADAAALLTIGENDPWHPDAVRGAAGLHYALPAVAAVERAPSGVEGRPLLALDPEGEEIDPAAIAAARGPRLRHRAPRPQRRAARRRRRPRSPCRCGTGSPASTSRPRSPPSCTRWYCSVRAHR